MPKDTSCTVEGLLTGRSYSVRVRQAESALRGSRGREDRLWGPGFGFEGFELLWGLGFGGMLWGPGFGLWGF